MKCWLGHDIIVTSRHPMSIGRNFVYFFVSVILGLSVVGLPLLYFLLVHTYLGCDDYIDGICTDCNKPYFDATDAHKKETKEREIREAKNRDARAARIALETKSKANFEKYKDMRKKALSE